MKTIHLKDISAADLIYPRNLFYLPLEVVLNSPHESLPTFPTVRAYELPSGEEDGIQYLMEVWADHGFDGHVEYLFMDKFILLSQDELPETFGGYVAILNEV